MSRYLQKLDRSVEQHFASQQSLISSKKKFQPNSLDKNTSACADGAVRDAFLCPCSLFDCQSEVSLNIQYSIHTDAGSFPQSLYLLSPVTHRREWLSSLSMGWIQLQGGAAVVFLCSNASKRAISTRFLVDGCTAPACCSLPRTPHLSVNC